MFFEYGKDEGVKVAVYRFPNLMGHSRPKYNSAVATFCWAVANDQPFMVNDRNTELELLYIDDLVKGMYDLLEGKERHCEYNGLEADEKADGRYCYVPVTHKVTLGEIVDLLEQFKTQPQTLMMPKMPNGSFAKKLYSLYLTYLPTEKFKYPLKMNVDDKRSFKSKKQDYLPRENWVVFKNTQKPIISEEIFELAQKMIKSRHVERPKEKRQNLFLGMLFCADCGKKMAVQYSREKDSYLWTY